MMILLLQSDDSNASDTLHPMDESPIWDSTYEWQFRVSGRSDSSPTAA